MSEEEKYWGCTPVVTAHMEARMKASREYAKMVSNDDETPAQRANIAKDFECGAIWEEGYSKKHGWHPSSELPPVDDAGDSKWLVVTLMNNEVLSASYNSRYGGWYREDGSKIDSIIKWWCYPPEE